MTHGATRLLQFARYPHLGRVKTRLKGALAESEILELHCQLLRYTNRVLNTSETGEVDLWLGGAPQSLGEDPFLRTLSARKFFDQTAGSLGAKMYGALTQTLALDEGVACALLVGSDCPFITSGLLVEARDALLGGADVVIGPAQDGGYYLIGMKSARVELFESVAWGTDKVLMETLAHINKCDLKYYLLRPLPDIDRPADLAKLATIPEFAWVEDAINL